MRFRSSLFVVPTTLIACLVACSGTTPGDRQFDPSGSGRSGDASTPDASIGKLSDGGPRSDIPKEGGTFLDVTVSGDGSLTVDSACAAEHVEAEEVPVDLFIMADRSSSMLGSGWTSLTSALNAFFTDPLSEGIWIALSFFPLGSQCDSQVPSCNGDLYYKPQVQWGLLPDHAATLAQTISATRPDGCTPTQDALNGVLRGAVDRQKALRDHIVATVMVSDGEPCCGMCPIEEAPGLGAIAAQYASGTPAIKTFAIYAADSATDSMAAIATGGGTGQAYNATGGTAAFIAALDDIRTTLIACEYKVPKPASGKVNPNAVQVERTSGAGTTQRIPRVKPPEQCGTNEGWHYDNDIDPARIILCPASCDTVRGDREVQVDILMGCESVQA